MSKRDTNKAREREQVRTRPEAVQCRGCGDFYTPNGPADSYHTERKCVNK